MINVSANPWVLRPRSNASAIIRLFCLPYAGGGPQVFESWPSGLPDDIEVCAVSLPGRGRRFSERSYEQLVPLSEALAAGLAPLLDRPFAFFGHSMGAFVAFETARRLRAERGVEPLHLFVSGAGAPHLPDRHQFHTLPDDRLIEALRKMNGIDPELLENAELLELLLPVLRSDFTAVENYVCRDLTPLGCPVSVFGGSRDWLVPSERLDPWRVLTSGRCAIDILDGDHFFLRASQRELLRVLATRLQSAIPA